MFSINLNLSTNTTKTVNKLSNDKIINKTTANKSTKFILRCYTDIEKDAVATKMIDITSEILGAIIFENILAQVKANGVLSEIAPLFAPTMCFITCYESFKLTFNELNQHIMDKQTQLGTLINGVMNSMTKNTFLLPQYIFITCRVIAVRVLGKIGISLTSDCLLTSRICKDKVAEMCKDIPFIDEFYRSLDEIEQFGKSTAILIQ